MKLKEGFILHSVSGRTVVVADGEMLNLELMIAMNDTGCFLWKQLEHETDKDVLVGALIEEYDIDKDTAAADVDMFIEKLEQYGLLEEV